MVNTAAFTWLSSYFCLLRHLQTGFISAMKIIRKVDIECLIKNEKDQMINQLIR